MTLITSLELLHDLLLTSLLLIHDLLTVRSCLVRKNFKTSSHVSIFEIWALLHHGLFTYKLFQICSWLLHMFTSLKFDHQTSSHISILKIWALLHHSSWLVHIQIVPNLFLTFSYDYIFEIWLPDKYWDKHLPWLFDFTLISFTWTTRYTLIIGL